MLGFAKLLIVLGVILLVLGGLVFLMARSGFAFGRLPGDFRWQSGNMTCVAALGTSLLLSVVLTIILNIVIRLLNR
jgi:hypothetical protein